MNPAYKVWYNDNLRRLIYEARDLALNDKMQEDRERQKSYYDSCVGKLTFCGVWHVCAGEYACGLEEKDCLDYTNFSANYLDKRSPYDKMIDDRAELTEATYNMTFMTPEQQMEQIVAIESDAWVEDYMKKQEEEPSAVWYYLNCGGEESVGIYPGDDPDDIDDNFYAAWKEKKFYTIFYKQIFNEHVFYTEVLDAHEDDLEFTVF